MVTLEHGTAPSQSPSLPAPASPSRSEDAHHCSAAALAAVEAAAACVPRKWRNVRALHVKSPESTALPLYSAPGTGVEDNDGDGVLEAAKPEGTPTKEEQGRTKRRKKSGMGCN